MTQSSGRAAGPQPHAGDLAPLAASSAGQGVGAADSPRPSYREDKTIYTLYAICPAGEFPVLAMTGETGARRRYALGGPFDDPSEVNQHQLQTGVVRAFESPGVYEVVVRRTRSD